MVTWLWDYVARLVVPDWAIGGLRQAPTDRAAAVIYAARRRAARIGRTKPDLRRPMRVVK